MGKTCCRRFAGLCQRRPASLARRLPARSNRRRMMRFRESVGHAMSLIAKILSPEHVLLDLDVSSKKRVFEQVGILFENSCGIARSDVFNCLFAREKLGSTGLGQGWRFRMAAPRAERSQRRLYPPGKRPSPMIRPTASRCKACLSCWCRIRPTTCICRCCPSWRTVFQPAAA